MSRSKQYRADLIVAIACAAIVVVFTRGALVAATFPVFLGCFVVAAVVGFYGALHAASAWEQASR